MNLLIDTLPETIEVGGKQVAISTDFRTGIRFELLLQESEGDMLDRMFEALALYFAEIPLHDLEGALEAMLRFYRCDDDDAQGGQDGAQTPRRVAQSYCFRQDARRILADFRAVYGIDLASATQLHWFTFRALFLALPAESETKTVMGYRVADTKSMSKAERKFYERMRHQHAIKRSGTAHEALSLAEYDRRMLAYVESRFERRGL